MSSNWRVDCLKQEAVLLIAGILLTGCAAKKLINTFYHGIGLKHEECKVMRFYGILATSMI